MINYTFSINGKDIVGIRTSVFWSYAIHRIPELTLRLSHIDEKADSEELAAFNLSKVKALKTGSKIEFVGKVNQEKAVLSEATFKGIITGQRISKDGHYYAEIIARGESIKLTEGEVTTVFKSDKHDDDTKIINTLAKLRGVNLALPKPDQAIKQEQFFVYQQTPWRAIMSRVLANGFLFVPSPDGDKIIHADDVKKAESSAIKMPFADSAIEHISVEQDISSQCDSVKFGGWDITKQAVTPIAEGASTALDKYLKPAHESLKITQEKNLAVPADAAELKSRASADLFYRQLDLAQGVLLINLAAAPKMAKLAPMDVLNLEDIGDTFSGKFLITGVRHEVSSNEWRLRIELGLHINYTLFSAWWRPPAIPNLIGIVGKFAEDPAKMHRLPVWLPGICPDDKHLLYARLATPFASGDQSGSFFPPNEKDEVIISFIGGDARFPVILGSTHNPVNTPPLKYAEKNEQVGFFWGKEKLGIHALLKKDKAALSFIGGEKITLTLDDKKGLEAVSEKTSISMGKTIVMSHSDTPTLTITDKDNTELATGTLAVNVDQKMEIT